MEYIPVIVMLVESRLFHGPGRKHSKDPAREIVVWQDGLLGWKQKLPPGFPIFHLRSSHHGKSPSMSSARPKQDRVQSFCFILKVSRLEPPQFLQALVAAGQTHMVVRSSTRKNVLMPGISAGHEHETEREGEGVGFFVPLGWYQLGFGTDQVLFQNDESVMK